MTLFRAADLMLLQHATTTVQAANRGAPCYWHDRDAQDTRLSAQVAHASVICAVEFGVEVELSTKLVAHLQLPMHHTIMPQ